MKLTNCGDRPEDIALGKAHNVSLAITIDIAYQPRMQREKTNMLYFGQISILG